MNIYRCSLFSILALSQVSACTWFVVERTACFRIQVVVDRRIFTAVQNCSKSLTILQWYSNRMLNSEWMDPPPCSARIPSITLNLATGSIKCASRRCNYGVTWSNFLETTSALADVMNVLISLSISRISVAVIAEQDE